jgi:hypothetical protein
MLGVVNDWPESVDMKPYAAEKCSAECAGVRLKARFFAEDQ